MICQHSHAFIQQTFTRGLWCPGSVEEDGHTSAVPDTIMKHTEAGGGQGGANTSLPCVVLEGKRGAELSVGLWTNDSGKGVSSPSLHCLLETPVLSRESSASLLTPSGLGIETDPGSYTLSISLCSWVRFVHPTGCLPLSSMNL